MTPTVVMRSKSCIRRDPYIYISVYSGKEILFKRQPNSAGLGGDVNVCIEINLLDIFYLLQIKNARAVAVFAATTQLSCAKREWM